MMYVFLSFLCISGFPFGLAEENATSKSLLQDSRSVLSTVANTVQKGIEKVPGVGDLIFRGCVEAPMICPNENITFWYYSNSHPTEGIQISESEASLSKLPRNSKHPWKVIIHGYTKSKEEIPNPQLRSAYFRHGNYNIISVDYAPLAKSGCYLQSVTNVPVMASCTAKFLDKLMDKGYFTPDNLHVIGFSLGAQIAGLIQQYLKHKKPNRVTGLDPASPLFDGEVNHRITQDAGQFVDVIHTNALFKGQVATAGHVDFYVNGGSFQPGCLIHRNESYTTCNHDRSPIYFAESINSDEGFWGIPCSSYPQFLTGSCNTHESELVIMGEYVPRSARGMYFLQTTDKSPFALGKRATVKLV